MLDLLGVPYMTDCITDAALSRAKDDAYRVYLTDCIYSLCASWGNPPKRRYYDILHPAPTDGRPAMEIAIERLQRGGIKVVD